MFFFVAKPISTDYIQLMKTTSFSRPLIHSLTDTQVKEALDKANDQMARFIAASRKQVAK